MSTDERFHCQFALPELGVVLRTDSGEFCQKMNGLGWPAAVVWPTAKKHMTQPNRKHSVGSPRRQNLTKPT